MNWLITGGAGFIGSHVVRDFLSAGHNVVVLDTLKSGIRERLPKGSAFHLGDCSDEYTVKNLLLKYEIDGVVNFAGLKHARESQREPFMYWERNIKALLGILSAIRDTSVETFIQSSSCSIYGSQSNVSEESVICPLSTYGRTKEVSEMILRDITGDLNLSVISLRYFNVIGCDSFDFAHDTSTECLVPTMSRQIERGVPITIFGNSFSTRDGTCLRDYVDVRDLSSAHLLAANNSYSRKTFQALNVSSGTPISVLEIANTLMSAFGCENYPIDFLEANPVDPQEIWAVPSKTLLNYGWSPKFTLRESMTAHARNWMSSKFIG